MERLVNLTITMAAEGGERNEAELFAPPMPWPDLVAMVRRQMRSLVGPTRDLEDLTQSALERIVRALDRFEGRAEFSTYTYRVCARQAMNHWRWSRRWLKWFTLGESNDEPEDEPHKTALAMTLERERARSLHRALDRLSAPKRAAIVLCDLEELPVARVAEILECPEPTVRSRLRHARLELTALLAKDPCFRSESSSPGQGERSEASDPGGGA
ncbi:RNA polymerase sigma factor [Pendulispora albinea]|uniref:RNA polymerase sigma factor n=1 Tax=Pendulispora albinea TaxID=2741071 RepID=A0ABZ2LY25_9BACT